MAQTQMHAQPGPGLVSRIWQQIQDDDCFDLAAQIAFYFSLSLVPFCLVLAVIVGWLPSTQLWKSFATWIVTYLPRESQHLMFSTILGLGDDSGGFLSLGLITAIWSAASGFVSLMESLSIIYSGRDTRSYWCKLAVAIGVTLLAMAFSLACFGLMAFGHWGFDRSSSRFGRWHLSRTAWEGGRWVLTLLIMTLAIDLANYFLPDSKRRWRWFSPGSVFAVVTLVTMSAGFNIYIQHFSSYPKIYGAMGGFIILMLWIYIAIMILLVGAETDRAMEPAEERSRAG